MKHSNVQIIISQSSFCVNSWESIFFLCCLFPSRVLDNFPSVCNYGRLPNCSFCPRWLCNTPNFPSQNDIQSVYFKFIFRMEVVVYLLKKTLNTNIRIPWHFVKRANFNRMKMVYRSQWFVCRIII